MAPLRRFTEEQLREFAKRCSGGESLHSIALEQGCCSSTISKNLKKLGFYLLFRKQLNYNPGNFVPTLQEIEKAKAEIQEGWSVTEEKQRAGVPLHNLYEIQEVTRSTHRRNGKVQISKPQ